MSNPTPDTVQMTAQGTLIRDANDTAVQTGGMITSNSLTLSGSNTTVATPVFRVTGTVHVLGLWGVVTTDLGTNHTAAYFRLNDQTAQANITLNTGTTLSAIKAGSTIVKKGLAAAAVTKLDNAAGVVSEPTTLETTYFSPFVAVKKTAATTDIEYVYSTTETPTSGAIQFFAMWYPVSQDGRLIPV